MKSSHTSGLATLHRIRVLGLLVALVGAFLLTFASAANANDTDGGAGQGTGLGGDGCVKSGWRLINDIDDMVWQDNGSGAECGNTAFSSINNANNREIEFRDQNGTLHRCNSTVAARNLRCGPDWDRDNTSLYVELRQMSSSGCYRRTDVFGIWYLQDAGISGVRSWTNLGAGPDGQYRTVGALRAAIDGTLQDSGTRGSSAWWNPRVEEWLGEDSYAELRSIAGLSQDQIADLAHSYLKSQIRDEVGGNSPVIYCWFNTAEASGATCAEIYGPLWDAYLHPAGVDENTPYGSDCFLRCPTAQGEYPERPPHAGEWIPNPNSSLTPRPAGFGPDSVADYCFPPLGDEWHQGGWGSEIPGIGLEVQESSGGSGAGSAHPYAYITTLEDGNDPYSASAQTGNAPGQGQLSPRSAAVKSSFGEFWDTYCSGPAGWSGSCNASYFGDVDSPEYRAFVRAYNRAVARLPRDSHATLNLTPEEKDLMARGRILNVVERVSYSTASGNSYRDRFYTRLMSQLTHYNMAGQVRASVNSVTPWVYDPDAHPSWNGERVPDEYRDVYRPNFAFPHPDRTTISTDLAGYGSTPKVSGLWQAATAHCNAREFGDLNPPGVATGLNDTGVLPTGDVSQYYSASAVYKVSDSRWRIGEQVDLSEARWGKYANNASSRPAFFDRICFLPGSAKNADNNSVTTELAPKEYTVFRDGERYLLKGAAAGNSPYFVPDFGPLGAIDGANVVTTRPNPRPTQMVLTRDPLGTPDTDLMTLYGVNGSEEVPIFSEEAQDLRTPKSEGRYQQQFVDSLEFKSGIVAVLDGSYRQIKAKSIWATDKALPQVVTMAWYYDVDVRSRFPVNNVGYGLPGGRMTYQAGTHESELRGRVHAVNDSLLSPPTPVELLRAQNEVWANSGTNIEDNLNVPLYYGATRESVAPYRWTGQPTRHNRHYFTVSFVRAIGE